MESQNIFLEDEMQEFVYFLEEHTPTKKILIIPISNRETIMERFTAKKSKKHIIR
jgi:hypothetical protein